MPVISKQFILKQRPHGLTNDDTWHYQETELPELEDNQVLLKVRYISIDPAMRVWLNPEATYLPAVELNQVMRALCLAEVIETKSDQYRLGSYVTGLFGVQSYAVADADQLIPVLNPEAPLPKTLSILGISGLTAYIGLLEIGQPKTNETLLVSAAAGSVGAIACQIGKEKQLQVVGLCGSNNKCQYLKEELSIEHAINYKACDWKSQLAQAAPQGIDLYFDNVGPPLLDDIMPSINNFGRIIACGAIASYNYNQKEYSLKSFKQIISKRIRYQGFVVTDYLQQCEQAMTHLNSWLQSNQLKSKEHIIDGLERFPEVFNYLFEGKNFGKLLLRV